MDFSNFDLYIVYRIIKILSTPWDEQPAYKLGIISASGKPLIKTYQLETREQKQAYTILHRFVFNLKRLIEIVPGGKTKIASYAAALFLLREDSDNLDELTMDARDISIDELFQMQCLEDAPANNVGGGAIAGLGVGPQGEPPIPLSKRKKRFLDLSKKV